MENSIEEHRTEIDAPEHMHLPVTRIELVRLLQPLREIAIPMFQAAMSSLVILANESKVQSNSDQARKSFAEMEPILTFIEQFDEQMRLLVEGQPDRPDAAQS